MKYKKQSIFIVASFMAVAALAGLSTLDNFGFSFSNRKGNEEPIFEINGNSTFTELSGGGYSGIASDVNSTNSVTLNFIGFNYDDQADNLYIPKGGNAYFMNTTPIRGISNVSFSFASKSSEDIKFSTLTFFSYNQLTFENIQAGKYIDLFYEGRDFSDRTTASWSYVSSNEPKMLETRYMMTVFYVTPDSEDLELGSVRYETPCAEEPEYKEIGQVSDWSNEVKAAMTATIGEVLPFVPFAAYDFDADDLRVETLFFSQQSLTAYKNSIVALGFQKSYETDMTGALVEIYQKEVSSAVYSVELMLAQYGVVTVTYIAFTDQLDRIYSFNSWPTQFIEEKLGSSAASNVPAFDDSLFESVHYTGAAQAGKKDIIIMIDNGSNEITAAHCATVKTYLQNLIANYDYVKVSENEYSNYYSASAMNIDTGLYFGVTSYPAMNTLQIEIILYDKLSEFPIDELNLTMGATLPDYNATGQYFIITDDDADRKRFSVNVFYADQSDMEAYAEALEIAGYTISSTGSNSIYLKGTPFDKFEIDLHVYEYKDESYLTISFSVSSYNSGLENYDSLESYVQYYYTNQESNAEELLSGYNFPAITGEHTYIYDSYGSYSPNYEHALFISGLGQAWVDSLVSGKAYYRPEKGYILNSNADYSIVVKVKVYSQGIKLIFKLLYNSSMEEFVTMAQANTNLAAWYNNLAVIAPNTYSPIDTADFSDVEDIIPLYIDDDAGYVYQYCGDTSFNIKIYTDDPIGFINDYDGVILGLGAYQYSELQGYYYDTNHYVSIYIQYADGEDYLTISYNLEDRDFRDFVDKDHIDLSDLDKWPVIDSGNAKIYDELQDYGYPDGDQYRYNLTIKKSYDLTAYKASLEAAGYSYKSIGYDTDAYYKFDNNHRLLEVEIDNDYYSYPLNNLVQITYVAEYDRPFVAFNTAKGSLVESNIGNLIPAAGANDYARISSDYDGGCLFDLEAGFDKAAYGLTLVGAGFTKSNDNVYYKQDGNSLITATFISSDSEVLEQLQVIVEETNWDAYPDKDMTLYLFSALAPYIPAMSTDSSEKYFDLVQNNNYNYTLKVKKGFDLDSYLTEYAKDEHVDVTKSEDRINVTYTIEGEYWYQNYSIYMTITDKGGYYEVYVSASDSSYWLANNMLSLEKIDNVVFGGDGVFAAIGDFSFNIKNHYIEVSEDTYINIYNSDSSELDAFKDLMDADTNFELDTDASSSNFFRYTYTVNGYMYEVVINTGANVVCFGKIIL